MWPKWTIQLWPYAIRTRPMEASTLRPPSTTLMWERSLPRHISMERFLVMLSNMFTARTGVSRSLRWRTELLPSRHFGQTPPHFGVELDNAYGRTMGDWIESPISGKYSPTCLETARWNTSPTSSIWQWGSTSPAEIESQQLRHEGYKCFVLRSAKEINTRCVQTTLLTSNQRHRSIYVTFFQFVWCHEAVIFRWKGPVCQSLAFNFSDNHLVYPWWTHTHGKTPSSGNQLSLCIGK